VACPKIARVGFTEILRCSSAVAKKSQTKNDRKKISSLFVSVLTEPRRLRFSRARDVLPFCGLPLQFVSNVQIKINNRRSRQDHITAA
jgi:hypothetical protein